MRKTILKDLEIALKEVGSDAEKLSGKTILISGGAGFIGTYINTAIYLLNKNVLKKKCKVISIDSYITGSKKNFIVNIKDKNFRHVKHNITKPFAIRGKVDYIIHAAGLASPFYYKKYPIETIESAILGSRNLLEIAKRKKARGFLFFSSSEIYGNPDPAFVPTPETYLGNVSSIGPRACYDESKRLSETLCITYYDLFGIPVKIVRPFNIYGPGMKHNDYRVIPRFLYEGLKGNNLPVHGNGNQTRTFCYITDALTGIFKVLLSGKAGEVYNLGNDYPEVSMSKLSSYISKISGNGVKAVKIPYPSSYPSGEPQRRCPDLGKIKKELGYSPKIDLKTGLEKTAQWFRYKYKLR